MNRRKGQVSVELLVVIGFIVILFIPTMLFVYQRAGELNRGIGGMESRLLISKLAFISNSLGYMGEGNSLKAEFVLPDRVDKVEFLSLGYGGEVMVTMDDGTQLSQVTKFPFQSTPAYFKGGSTYKLEFLSQNGTVFVKPSN